MARSARTEPSLTEWAVLGLLRERPAHGWDIARAFVAGRRDRPASGRSAGRSSTARSPCFATSATSTTAAARRARPARSACSLAPTPRGRQALRRWLARPDRARPRPPLRAAGQAAPPRAQPAATRRRCSGRSSRCSSAASSRSRARVARDRAASTAPSRSGGSRPPAPPASFVEALLDERIGEPINYEAIGYVRSAHTLARRDAAATGGRRVGPVSDRPHRAAPRLPPGSRRLLARLGDRAPPRVRRLGRRPSTRSSTTSRAERSPPARRTGRTRSRSRSARSSRSSRTASSSTGSTCSTARRCSTSSPTCRSSTRPAGPVAAGWFADRAELIFDRRSDSRFKRRSVQ